MTRVLLSRIERVERVYDVTATLADGSPATVATIDVALLPLRTAPTGATTWTAYPVTTGEVTVLLAGPDASPTSAVVVPVAGGTLWFREVDSPEVIPIPADDFIVY
jgi:hypothetical protein